MFNLAIDSKLCACDLTALTADDVAMSGKVQSHCDPKENWAAGPVRNHRADAGYGCSLDEYGRTSIRTRQYAGLVSRRIACHMRTLAPLRVEFSGQIAIASNDYPS
jgi:hypothetical protein